VYLSCKNCVQPSLVRMEAFSLRAIANGYTELGDNATEEKENRRKGKIVRLCSCCIFSEDYTSQNCKTSLQDIRQVLCYAGADELKKVKLGK